MPRMTIYSDKEAVIGNFLYRPNALAFVKCDWLYVKNVLKVRDIKGLKKLLRASKKYKKFFHIELKDQKYAIRRYNKRIKNEI